MIFSRPRVSNFRSAILGLFAFTFSGLAPALAQGEDEVFHYLIPLAEAVNLCESGQHEQAVNKTKKLLTKLGNKSEPAWSRLSKRRPLPVLRGDTTFDVYQQIQAEALALRGLSSYTLKRTPQALADLKQASALCPQNAYILTELGTVYVKSKKPKEGIAVLSQAIKFNQNIREAYFMRAIGYQQIGKMKESESDLARSQKIFTDQQNKIDSLTERIDKLARENKLSEAIELDRQLLQIAPRDGLVLTGYADHLMADGKYKDALQYVSTSIALDPSIGYSYRVRSVINGHLQNFDSELRDANIAFNIEPRSAEALNSRAIANLDSDQPVQAIRDFDLLIKRKPDFPDAYINRSTAYLRIGEFEKAIRDAKQAVALVPTSPYGYQCLGAACRRGGKLKEAREALETSLRYATKATNDSVAMAKFNLGAVLLALKDSKGTEQIDAAIKSAPNLPEIFLQRGAYNASPGKIDDAIKILTLKPKRNLNTTNVSNLAKTPAPKPSRIVVEKPVDPRKREALIAAAKSEMLKKMTAPKPVVPRPSASKIGSAKPASLRTTPAEIPKTAAKVVAAAPPVFRKIQVSTLDLQDCILVANRVIETSPGKPEAYYARGLAYLCLKQYDQSISDFRKLAHLTKTGIPYKRALALCYLALERMGKTNEAKDCLQLAAAGKSTGTTSGGKNPDAINLSDGFPELKYFRNEVTEAELFAGKLTTKELTRIHSYLGFHYKSIADKTKPNPHVQWVLDRGDVSSPEFVLTASDTVQRVSIGTP